MMKWERIRAGIIVVIITIFGVFLVGRSLYLQIYNKNFLTKRLRIQCTKYIKIKGARGKILDKNNDILAMSIKGYSVWANPLQINSKERDHVVKALTNYLGLNEKEIKKKLAKKAYFVWIKRKISFGEYEKLKKLKLSGIHFIEEYKRIYPNKKLASNILGFCNIDGVGIEGVEYKYDSYLAGKEKKIKIIKDAKNNIVSGFDPDEQEKFNGDNVYLTIDRKLQSIVEATLKSWVNKYNAEKGVIIVMDPNTGEILSMASYPDFDPNYYWRYPNSYYKNLAISFNYEPGSTFKPIIIAYGLKKHLFDLDLTLFISKTGYIRYKTIDIHDHGIHEWLNVEGIVVHSSNIGMTRLADYLGKIGVYKCVKMFGFGEKTGINLPGEAKGIVRDLKDFSSVTHVTMSFGQGISVTPIQLIRAYAALINGGYLLRPIVVKKITTPKGKIIKEYNKFVIKRVIPDSVSKKIRKVLVDVVKYGTGRAIRMSSLVVGGKTGTAQVASRVKRGYQKGDYISSFVGFFPADKPEYLMLMLIVKPQKEYYASEVVCPEFKILAQEIMGYKSNKILTSISLKTSNNNSKGIVGLTKKEILGIMKNKKVKKFKFIGNGFAVKKIYNKKKKLEIVYFN